MSRQERERQDYDMVSAREWASSHETVGRTSLKIPSGVQLFQVKKAGVLRLDIIPYRVGKGNPSAAEGKVYWQRTYFIHRNVGSGGDSFVCPKRSSGGNLRCPICEDVTRLFKTLDDIDDEGRHKKEKDRIVGMAAKERQLFNVIDRDNPDKGIQVWENSFHLFGKFLKGKLDNMEPDDDYDWFHHPVKGYTLRIIASEEKMGANKYYECSDIEFKQRKEPYPMSIIDEAHCLDEMPKLLTYEELQKVYLQVPDDADDSNGKSGKGDDRTESRKRPDYDEDERPAPKRKPRDEDEEEDDALRKKHAARDEEDDDAPRRPAAKNRPADDEDEPSPKAAGKRVVTAEDAGLEEGHLVMYGEIECEIMSISRDGTSLTLQDEDGEMYRAVSPAGVKRYDKKEEPPARKRVMTTDDDPDEVPPPKKASAKKPVDDEEEEPVPRRAVREPVEDDEEESPTPKKAGGKAAAKVHDDDDAPPPRKAGGRK